MKKLHTRMLLFILAPTMLFISGMILYVSYTVHDMAINDAELILEAQGASLAKDLSLEFEKALRSVQTISQSYQGVISEGNMPRREGANGMLKQLLENNPNYLSAWMFWQPNAFDGLDEEYVFTAGHDATGRFIPVWTKNQSGDLIVEPVVGYDTDLVFQQQLNYVLTGKNAIFEPFYYELNGENVLITSIVAPVIVNGRTLGMTGVDISLNNLNQLVREYTFYDHGFAGLMTNTGNVISHENQDLIGSNYFESTAMSERNDVEQVREAVQMGESAKIIGFSNVLQKDVYRLFTPLYMEGIHTPWSAFLAAPIDEVSSKAKSLTMIITTVSIIVLLFLSIIILWVTKHIVQPIRAAVEHGQEMAAGDFTRSVPELYLRRKDEIGQLAKIFATIREHMSVLIGQVQESTRLVLQSANSLAAGANQATSAANEVTTSIEEVAQAAESQMHSSAESAKSMEEMSHGVQRVAQAATAVSASVQEMNDRASLGQRNIENAVQQMDHLHHETNESKIIMERLQDGASQIVSIVDMITDISEQTNLLALNAAIEAARAGEAGKGFAVVAEEVRKLADETKDFASEIQELIGAIQTESNQATLAMNTNVAEVQRGIEHMQEVGQVFTQINTAVQEIVKETEELSAIAEEMSAGTEEIAAAAEEIASSAEVSAGHTQHVAAAAEEQLASMEVVTRTSESLQVMARQLNELLEQFKV